MRLGGEAARLRAVLGLSVGRSRLAILSSMLLGHRRVGVCGRGLEGSVWEGVEGRGMCGGFWMGGFGGGGGLGLRGEDLSAGCMGGGLWAVGLGAVVEGAFLGSFEAGEGSGLARKLRVGVLVGVCRRVCCFFDGDFGVTLSPPRLLSLTLLGLAPCLTGVSFVGLGVPSLAMTPPGLTTVTC